MNYDLVHSTSGLELSNKDMSIKVDFLEPSFQYTLKKGGKPQLIRSLGDKARRILDGTAGLGRDAVLMARFGFDVLAVERSPIVYELLLDGVRRAKENPEMKSLIESKLQFKNQELKEVLSSIKENEYDVIYLDFMFPQKKKKALPKKEMQVLEEFLGIEDENESRDLLILARKKVPRVVVKRPLRAEALEKEPRFSLYGESTRFDIYC